MANKRFRVAKTATEGLKLLWEEGFFREWKNWSTINSSLAKKGNHFGDAELGMALKRAKHLTRKGKPGSFEYVQKYPYVAEDGSSNEAEERSHEQKRNRRKAS